jgi:hypothetical protein
MGMHDHRHSFRSRISPSGQLDEAGKRSEDALIQGSMKGEPMSARGRSIRRDEGAMGARQRDFDRLLNICHDR